MSLLSLLLLLFSELHSFIYGNHYIISFNYLDGVNCGGEFKLSTFFSSSPCFVGGSWIKSSGVSSALVKLRKMFNEWKEQENKWSRRLLLLRETEREKYESLASLSLLTHRCGYSSQHHTHTMVTFTLFNSPIKTFIQHFAKAFYIPNKFQRCDINDIRAVHVGLSCQGMIATNIRVSSQFGLLFYTACEFGFFLLSYYNFLRLVVRKFLSFLACCFLSVLHKLAKLMRLNTK